MIPFWPTMPRRKLTICSGVPRNRIGCRLPTKIHCKFVSSIVLYGCYLCYSLFATVQRIIISLIYLTHHIDSSPSIVSLFFSLQYVSKGFCSALVSIVVFFSCLEALICVIATQTKEEHLQRRMCLLSSKYCSN